MQAFIQQKNQNQLLGKRNKPTNSDSSEDISEPLSKGVKSQKSTAGSSDLDMKQIKQNQRELKKQAKIDKDNYVEKGDGPIELMLAKSYEPEKVDPKGWLMSEKLDGVRCYWNGDEMYSRNGLLFYPPDFFKNSLPKNLALDGELWTKRDDFQNAVSIVKRQDKNDEWKQITYMVYDAPLETGNFKERLAKMEKILNQNHSSYVKIHKQVICKSVSHLDEETEKVFAQKGEGMMIKDPKSKYERKRSGFLLKVKKFDDDEATIIGYEEGTGKYKKMMGAIKVKNKQGVEFKIGSGFTDDQRIKPPKIGQKVTYKYQGLTKGGVPRFPIFMRKHPDL